jgi:rhodanese-related sulfurtransferase
LLHVPYGVVVCAIVIIAMLGFRTAQWWETFRSSSGSSGSSEFLGSAESGLLRGTPRNREELRGTKAAAAAILLGALAPFAGSPYRATSRDIDVQKLVKEVGAEQDHVTALELAAWIKDRKPGLRVLDLRSEAEFDEYHVPSSESIAFDALVSSAHLDKNETLVLISDGGAHAAQAWVFLRALGHPHVYFLRGGLGEWLDDVMNPTKTSELTRYFGATPRTESTADTVTKMKRRGC